MCSRLSSTGCKEREAIVGRSDDVEARVSARCCCCVCDCDWAMRSLCGDVGGE